MRFLALVFINLRRHKLRALIGVAGIGFGVAAMLTILSIVNGAIGMFERILAVDSHYLVFEKNVSDLFFSSVPDDRTAALRALVRGHAEVEPVRHVFGLDQAFLDRELAADFFEEIECVVEGHAAE